MKKIGILITLILVGYTQVYAQFTKGISGDSNWLRNWTDFKPTNTVYNAPTNILTGIISTNTTLYKKYTYQLVGQVYVTNNAVLNIESGTVIRGDKQSTGTLIITKGAKLVARGSATDPIVFTSNNNDYERKPGDWGGIVILGDAPINKIGGEAMIDYSFNTLYAKYGGANIEDNSGMMSYVRIEFAGKQADKNKILGGLTMAGVGNKTKIENVQVSFSSHGSFQGLGGTVRLNNLVSYRSIDDDFYFSQGINCRLTNSLAVRHPYSSSNNGSSCFEVESYDIPQNVDFSKPFTKVVASNITMVNTEDNNQGLVKEAIMIRENAAFTLDNSVVSGFSSVVLFDKKIYMKAADLSKIKLKKLLINGCKKTFEGEDNKSTSYETAANVYFMNVANQNEVKNDTNENVFIQSSLREEVDFRLKNKTVVAEN